MKILLTGYIAVFLCSCLLGQKADSLIVIPIEIKHISKPPLPREPIQINWDNERTVQKDSTYFLGREQAFADIRDGKIYVELTRPPWCPENWIQPLEDHLYSELGLTVNWSFGYELLPKPGYSPLIGPLHIIYNYDDGYKSVMDSTLQSIANHKSLEEIMEFYKKEYGANEFNCPSQIHGAPSNLPKQLQDRTLLNLNFVNYLAERSIPLKGYIIFGVILSANSTILDIKPLRNFTYLVDSKTGKSYPSTNLNIESLGIDFVKTITFDPCTAYNEPVACSFNILLQGTNN